MKLNQENRDMSEILFDIATKGLVALGWALLIAFNIAYIFD